MKWKELSPAQIDDVIAEANSAAFRSAEAKGRIDAQGLVASELKTKRPLKEVIAECTSALSEAAAWKPTDLENVIVGSYGSERLAEIICADVWTHGNLWRANDRQLTPEACKWFSDYSDAFIAELHEIVTDLAGARWGN